MRIRSQLRYTLGTLALALGATVDGQEGRQVDPFRSEIAAIKAEERQLDKEAARLDQVKSRYNAMKAEWDAQFKDWKARWDKNKAFGNSKVSRSAWRDAHDRWLETRRSLQAEAQDLSARGKRLQEAKRGFDADLKALQERRRYLLERAQSLARLMQKGSGGVVGGGYSYVPDGKVTK